MVDATTLDEALVRLIGTHPDQWDGCYKGEIVVAPTIEEVFEKLGDRAKYAAWAHLSTAKMLFLTQAA